MSAFLRTNWFTILLVIYGVVGVQFAGLSLSSPAYWLGMATASLAYLGCKYIKEHR